MSDFELKSLNVAWRDQAIGNPAEHPHIQFNWDQENDRQSQDLPPAIAPIFQGWYSPGACHASCGKKTSNDQKDGHDHNLDRPHQNGHTLAGVVCDTPYQPRHGWLAIGNARMQHNNRNCRPSPQCIETWKRTRPDGVGSLRSVVLLRKCDRWRGSHNRHSGNRLRSDLSSDLSGEGMG